MIETKLLSNSLINDASENKLYTVKNHIKTANYPANGKVENVYLVLPAYNEEESLPNLLNRVMNLTFVDGPKLKVVLVNDGSSDRTEQVAKENFQDLNMTIVNHEKNMGLGQAVQTGIKEALSQSKENDVIVIMDADDTHDTALIEVMVTKIEDGADIVIASRFVEGGNDKSAPPFRRLLSRGASLIFQMLLPLDKINDFTSGYRAYKVGLLNKASKYWGETLVVENGFACMVELLLKLRHWQPNVVEIPFYLRYDRKLGASKLKLFKTLFQYLKLGIRDRVSPPPRRI